MKAESHGSQAMTLEHVDNLYPDRRDANVDDFLGHLFPAIYFFATALWWIIGSYIRYYSCLRSGATFQSSLWYPFRGCNYPLECIIRMVMSVGLIIAVIYGRITLGEKYPFVKIESMYHATAFATFLLVDVFILMRFKGYQSPVSVEYWSLGLALTNTAILFVYHTHDNDLVNVRTHRLLVMVLLSAVAVVVAEMGRRNSVQIALARSYLTTVSGTWLLHVGFMLNPMPGMKYWDERSHNDVMLVTLMFSWHCIANFIVMLVIGRLVLWIGFNDDVEPTKDHELAFNKNGRPAVNGQNHETKNSGFEPMNGYTVEYST